MENLARIGQLKREERSESELLGLLRSGQRRLRDAENGSLSLESRFDLGYNGSHAISLAALRWHGYRSESRYLVFQCLQHTLGLPREQWRVLDEAHRRRNLAEYEGILDVDSSLVEAVLRVGKEVERRALALLEGISGESPG